MSFQYRDIGPVVIGEFTVGTVTDIVSLAQVPEESGFIIGDGSVAFRIIISPAASVAGGPGFFEVIGGVGAKAPVVSVSAHFAVHIEVVKQDEFLCQLMLIGGHLSSKKQQTRIPVSSGHVCEHLVIGAVFLDDIENIFDRRGIAYLHGYGVPSLSFCTFFLLLGIWAIAVNLTGESSQCCFVRFGEDAHFTLEQSANVFCFPFLLFIAALIIYLFLSADRIRAVRVGSRRISFSVSNEEFFPYQFHLGRIPAGRDESFGRARPRIAHIKYGEAVVVRIGDIKCALVVAQCHAVAGRSARCIGEEGRIQGLHCFSALHVSDGYGIVIGVGNIEVSAIPGKGHFIGIVTDIDRIFDPHVPGISYKNFISSPE